MPLKSSLKKPGGEVERGADSGVETILQPGGGAGVLANSRAKVQQGSGLNAYEI